MRRNLAYTSLLLLVLATNATAEGKKKKIGARVTKLEARVSEIEKTVSRLAARIQVIEDQIASADRPGPVATPGQPDPNLPDAAVVVQSETIEQPAAAKEMTPGEARLQDSLAQYWKDWPPKELSSKQKKRRRFINDRRFEGYWGDVRFDGTSPTVWVEDKFLLLDEKTQNQFLGVIYAFWSEKEDSFGGEGVVWDPLLVRKDTGVAVSRLIGTYTPYDGLK